MSLGPQLCDRLETNSSLQSNPPAPSRQPFASNQVNKKIFVRGLPWETTDQSLRAVFEQYGEIAEVGCRAVVDMVESAGGRCFRCPHTYVFVARSLQEISCFYLQEPFLRTRGVPCASVQFVVEHSITLCLVLRYLLFHCCLCCFTKKHCCDKTGYGGDGQDDTEIKGIRLRHLQGNGQCPCCPRTTREDDRRECQRVSFGFCCAASSWSVLFLQVDHTEVSTVSPSITRPQCRSMFSSYPWLAVFRDEVGLSFDVH